MRRTLVFVTVSLITVAAPAFAQQAPGAGLQGSSENVDEIRKHYRIHVGPFYITPAFLLKELGVDTNVFNQGDQPQSDLMATVGPQAQIATVFGRRAVIRTSVGTDFVYYRKFASERSVDPNVAVRGELLAKRLTLYVQDSYLNTRQRPNFEIDLRSRHLENDAAAGASVRIAPRTSVEFAARREETRYNGEAVIFNQPLKQTLDRNGDGFGVSLSQALTPLTTVSIGYDRRHDRFPHAPERDTDTYSVVPAVAFKPKALIKGTAAVGYRNFKPKNPLIPAYTGLVSQLGLSYNLLGSTVFSVIYDRDTSYSFEVQNPYYLDNSVGGSVRRQLGGRFDAIVTGARHRYEYRTLGQAAVDPHVARTDTTDTYGANVGYRMQGRTRVGVGVTYYTRRSSRALFRDYHGLHIGTTVTYGFER